MAQIDGGTGPDTLKGTRANDVINGFAGNDFIEGGGGDDVVLAGDGDDSIYVGRGVLPDASGVQPGRASVDAGAGNDTITAYSKDLTSYTHTINGGEGDDFVSLQGARTGQLLDGGNGNDRIQVDISGASGDVVWTFSNATHAFLIGQANGPSMSNFERLNAILGAGNDVVVGGAGDDQLVGGFGRNNLSGGAGDDYLQVSGVPTGGAHTLNGGDGAADRIGLYDLPAGNYTIDVVTNQYLAQGVSFITATGIEAFNGAIRAGTSTIALTDLVDFLITEGGASTVNARGGNDDLTARGSGRATIDAGAGDDGLRVQDTIAGSFFGGDGADLMVLQTVGTAANGSLFDGGGGDDRITWVGQSDLFFGGPAASTNHTLNGGAGTDRLDITSFTGNDWRLWIPFVVGGGVEFRKFSTTGTASGDKVTVSGFELVTFAAVSGPPLAPTAAVNAGMTGGTYTAPTFENSFSGAFYGSPFVDVMTGVAGKVSNFVGRAGADTFTGMTAADQADYSTDAWGGGTLGIACDLAAGWSTDGFGSVDTLVNVNAIAGTNGLFSGAISDWLQGNDAANTIGAADGADYLFGRGGHDYLDSGEGADYVDGGAGNDTIFAGGSSTTTFDIVIAGDGNDAVNGSFNGRLYAEGGAGDDAISGGSMTLAGAEVVEYLFGDGGNDTINGNAGNDAVIGSNYLASGDDAQVDSLNGGAGNDYVLQGLWGRGRLAGGDGADTIVGAGGADTLVGGKGDDFLYGLGGADTFEFVLADLGPGAFDVVLDYAAGVDGTLLRGIAAANVVVTDGAGAAVVSISVAGGVHSIIYQNVTAAEVLAGISYL